MVGYPFVPAVFIAAAIYLVVNALYQDPVWTGITFAVVLAGLPVYYFWFRTRMGSQSKVHNVRVDTSFTNRRRPDTTG